MDFLDIRKKAKERARARAAEPLASRDERPCTEPPPREPPPAGEPALADHEVIDRALAARLDGDPPPGQTVPPGGDPRFTTWRPGAGEPPPVAKPDAPGGPLARAEDFVVVGTGGSLALSAASQPPPDMRLAPPVAPPDRESPRDPLEEFFYRPDEAAPALPIVAPVADVADEEPAVLVPEEYLTFGLGPEEYAVAIDRVHQVIRPPPITEVPRAPAHILGVVTVRGEVVAVVDPRGRLGLPAAPAGGQGKIVIVDGDEGPCGLLVDRVASVVRLRPGSIEPCPQGVAGQRSELLAGIGRAGGGRLFTVLDLGALLRRAPARVDGGQQR